MVGGIITGAQIKAARELLGWTQEKLAREAALSRKTLELLEAERERPAAVHLRVLYDVLNAAGIRFFQGEPVMSEDAVLCRASDRRNSELGY